MTRTCLNGASIRLACYASTPVGLGTNETPDWDNIIEEVESVGRGQLSAVRSLLVQALLHDLKCQAWPSSREVPHWRAEARGFRGDAAEAFTPSSRPRIDIDELYRRALSRLPESIDDQAPFASARVLPCHARRHARPAGLNAVSQATDALCGVSPAPILPTYSRSPLL